MRLEWTKEQLIRPMGRHWWVCGICRQGTISAKGITHTKQCPFSDPTVTTLFFEVGPKHDADICGRCDAQHDECPVMIVTHERLLELCQKYAAGCESAAACRRLRVGLVCRTKTDCGAIVRQRTAERRV